MFFENPNGAEVVCEKKVPQSSFLVLAHYFCKVPKTKLYLATGRKLKHLGSVGSDEETFMQLLKSNMKDGVFVHRFVMSFPHNPVKHPMNLGVTYNRHRVAALLQNST